LVENRVETFQNDTGLYGRFMGTNPKVVVGRSHIEFLKENIAQHRIVMLAGVGEYLFERRSGHTAQASRDHSRLNELRACSYNG
jgi:hypothetical protein